MAKSRKEKELKDQPPLVPTSSSPRQGKTSTPPKDSQQNESSGGSLPSSQRREINWLKDSHMLPEVYPDARIMTFGYPTTLIHSDTVETSPADALVQIARGLLQQLNMARNLSTSNSGQPIIFIGHRFGGVVIEKALVLAREENFHQILQSTVGLIFLSTPFLDNEASLRRAGIGKTNRVQQILSRFSLPSTFYGPVSSTSGKPAEPTAGSAQDGSIPGSVGDIPGPSEPAMLSPVPSIVAKSIKSDRSGPAQPLDSERDPKMSTDLFNKFIQTVKAENIRMTCFVNGTETSTTDLQVSDLYFNVASDYLDEN